MDLAKTIVPRSDQLNADDLIGGPVTVTIVEVREGDQEQPAHIVTEEFGPGRPYKPGLSMRRVLVEAWGRDTDPYVGRRMTLYRDPKITFGRDEVGGIRISHLSHIDGPLQAKLTTKRGKRAPFTVQPLPDVAPQHADPQRTQQALGAFEQIGVTREQLEQHVGRPVDAWTPDDLTGLQAFYGEAKAAAVVEPEVTA